MGGCCGATTKCLLVMINIPITLAGLAMVVVGGVFKVNEKMSLYPELDDFSSSFSSITLPVIILGAVFLIIGFLGCIGACTEKGWLLKPYFFLVSIIVVAQIALIIAGAVKKEEFKDELSDGIDDLFTRYKGQYVEKDEKKVVNEEAIVVNTFQNVLQCCGYTTGPGWWKSGASTKFPPGCCSGWKYESNIIVTEQNALAENCNDLGKVFMTDCTTAIDEFLDSFGLIIIGVIAGIVLFEFLCLAAACFIWKRGGGDNEFA